MSDISSTFDEAWRRFQGVDRLRLLQETQEWDWTRGRTDYVAFLIDVNDDEVREHISEAISRIERIRGVDPYPERYWHVTVKGIGFMKESPEEADEVSPDEVQRLADDARSLLEPASPCELTVGAVNAFDEVVFLEVNDEGCIRSLNQAMLAQVPGLRRYDVDGEVFLPHVSIARFSSEEGLDELKQTLAEMRDEGASVSFMFDEVLLVQAHLAAEAPTFDLLAEYKFGG